MVGIIRRACALVLILTIPTCSIADILYFRSSKKRTCEIVSISDSTFVIQSKKRAYNKRRPATLEEISIDDILAYKYTRGILTPVTIETSADSLAFNILVEQGTPKVIEQKVSPLQVFFLGVMFYIVALAIHDDKAR